VDKPLNRGIKKTNLREIRSRKRWHSRKWNIEFDKINKYEIKNELINNKFAQHKEQWTRSDFVTD